MRYRYRPGRLLLCAACLAFSLFGVPPGQAGASEHIGPPTDAAALLSRTALLYRDVTRAPGFSQTERASLRSRLARLRASLQTALDLRHAEDALSSQLTLVAQERTAAQQELARFHSRVAADLRDFGAALNADAPVSATAASSGLTSTVDITSARLDLQQQSGDLVVTATAAARLTGALALAIANRLDARQLNGRIDALASGLHLGLHALISDLRVVQTADPGAAGTLQSHLISDLSSALADLDTRVLGGLDSRAAALRLALARLAAREAALLAPGAQTLDAVERDLLARQAASLPAGSPVRQQVQQDLSATGTALSSASRTGTALATVLDDLGSLQNAQDSIDRQVQAAQADIDTYMAQSNADLDTRLQSDVTLTISSTEETVHVHVDGIDSGSVARVLDVDVHAGLSVLRLAMLTATVTPNTATGSATGTHISGIDLLLQAHLENLQARVQTDVAAVRDEQNALQAKIRARIAALRTTLGSTIVPLITRRTQQAQQLRGQMDTDLASAESHLRHAQSLLASAP